MQRTRAVVVLAALAVGAATYLVTCHLPLEADLAYLLPADTPSVRDAERLAARMPARDVMLMVVRAPDPGTRAAAGQAASAGLRAIDPAWSSASTPTTPTCARSSGRTGTCSCRSTS